MRISQRQRLHGVDKMLTKHSSTDLCPQDDQTKPKQHITKVTQQLIMQTMAATYLVYGKVNASVWKNANDVGQEAAVKPSDTFVSPDSSGTVHRICILTGLAQNKPSFQHLEHTCITFHSMHANLDTGSKKTN